MKFFTAVLLVAVIGCALAAPPQDPQEVQVLRYDSDVQPEGYKFAWVAVCNKYFVINISFK